MTEAQGILARWSGDLNDLGELQELAESEAYITGLSSRHIFFKRETDVLGGSLQGSDSATHYMNPLKHKE